MLIAEILQKAHRKFAKDTDYPTTGTEDILVRLDHVDDAISEWENLTQEGYNWKELMTSASLTLAGSGTDALPTDFLSFIRQFDQDSELQFGSTIYTEVKAQEGARMEQELQTPYVFWHDGGNIHTLPAVSGTITLSYLKKATRYVTGEETTEPEMANPKFIEDFVTAKVFLDNDDNTLYSAYMTQANEKLIKMKYEALS